MVLLIFIISTTFIFRMLCIFCTVFCCKALIEVKQRQFWTVNLVMMWVACHDTTRMVIHSLHSSSSLFHVTKFRNLWHGSITSVGKPQDKVLSNTIHILPAVQQFTTIESSSVLCKSWSFLLTLITEWNKNTVWLSCVKILL